MRLKAQKNWDQIKKVQLFHENFKYAECLINIQRCNETPSEISMAPISEIQIPLVK